MRRTCTDRKRKSTYTGCDDYRKEKLIKFAFRLSFGGAPEEKGQRCPNNSIKTTARGDDFNLKTAALRQGAG